MQDIDVSVWRDRLKAGRLALRAAFELKPDTVKLLRDQCRLVDKLMCDIWQQSGLPATACLIAVGGYGRGELFPQSDVDILILLADGDDTTYSQTLEKLVGLFWDIGLAIGHSVRTLPECMDEAARDVTVRTNLLEARLLSGNRQLFDALAAAVMQSMDPNAFFEAKVREQVQRHSRFNDTAYNLEPNLKESPGGLRDLQNILWIARGIGLASDWKGLVQVGLLSPAEARQIRRHEHLLQHLRIRLHYLANRREDRLLFDHQNTLATDLGLRSKPRRRASEQLMQRYYRSAKFVGLMNMILLQGLREKLPSTDTITPIPIDQNFLLRGSLLEIVAPNVFLQHPEAILQSFLTMQRHPQITGMSTTTMRGLWQARHQVNREFRNNPKSRRSFMEILHEPEGILHALQRMHLFGILGRYIPAFGRITGQMQHDLFHVYTVDQHSLNVLRNVRRFTIPEHAHEFPLCSRLMAAFGRKEVLYLAAIFHDIAKGRGGDHSTLGAADARRFCRSHALSSDDTELVVWLVHNHLLMSATAQQQDISDPDVTSSFAQKMGDVRHLTALYLLTVADIRGTSPGVWNAWKSRLLESLYRSTVSQLEGKLRDLAEEITNRQAQAQEILGRYAIAPTNYQPLWQQLDDNYFLRADAREIAWNTRLLLTHIDTAESIVRARLSPEGDGIQVMIYSRDHNDLFAKICSFFERLGYSIVEARINTTKQGYALDNFLVLDESDRTVRYSGLIAHIEKELTAKLVSPLPPEPPLVGRISRRAKHFPLAPTVSIMPEEKSSSHVLSLVAGDRPGLLSHIAHVLLRHHATLHSARINTLGYRAEDTFVISGRDNTALPPATVQTMMQELSAMLSDPSQLNASGIEHQTIL
jgi:[protein-PII] uridylyltransferase